MTKGKPACGDAAPDAPDDVQVPEVPETPPEAAKPTLYRVIGTRPLRLRSSPGGIVDRMAAPGQILGIVGVAADASGVQWARLDGSYSLFAMSRWLEPIGEEGQA
jgi:hypothetical protein